MRINLTATQWRDIQICLLEAIRNSAKHGEKPDLDCPLNKRYLQTHDLIEMNKEVKL
jgi:anti-sigma regulatory factor (Ser/Thr protein kinase)